MGPAELAPVLAPASALLSVGDPTRTRTVYLAIVLLVALGLGLVLLAMWLARRTRVDPPVLAPLEVMGQRKWRRSGDGEWRQGRLDESRPAGAVTLAAIAPFIAADEAADAASGAGVFEAPPAVPVEGPILGPPAPVHAPTAEELDEILHRFDAPEPGTALDAVDEADAADEADEVDEGDEADADGGAPEAREPTETGHVEAADDGEPDDGEHLESDDITNVGADEHVQEHGDHADAVAGAPDEQPSHG